MRIPSILCALLFSALISSLLASCGVEYPNCNSDEDCPGANQFCRDGVCRGCREDSDCGGLCDVCREGRCARRVGCCQADNECPADYPKCGEDQLCQECNIDSHCDDQADVCLEGLCQRARCESDADCPRYKECKYKLCQYKKFCEFKVIYFDTDSNKLSDHQKQRIRENVLCFDRYSKETGERANLKITGYADERNDFDYNMRLSERRARSVLLELKTLGIPLNRIRPAARGEQQPLVEEAETALDHAHNRRVEFYVY